MKKIIVFISFCMAVITVGNAQSLFQKLKDKVKEKVEQKTDQKIEEKADKVATQVVNTPDSAFDKIKSATKKKSKTGTASTVNNTPTATQPFNATVSSTPTFQSFQNYDFIPGDKVLFEDDWRDDDVGEFPTHWKLDNGEFLVNKFEGSNAMVAKERSDNGGSVSWKIAPRMKKEDYLPKEFTIEMEVYFLPKKPREGFDDVTSHQIAIQLTGLNGTDTKTGSIQIGSWREGVCNTMDFANEFTKSGVAAGATHLLCTAYKNNQLKIYLDGSRLFTVPDVGFEPTKMALAFATESADQPTIIKHIRIAEGGSMNLVKKLTTATKFIARGIVFDYNQASIKPESMGELNRIVGFMNEDKTVKFEIGGHTDSDGDDSYNLNLSQMRADAVKAKLVAMGVDASRLSTKGYGETKPVADNKTPEGKANNRRVEFVKM